MKVYELLDKPEKWTQKEDARDKRGLPIESDHPNAKCWCVLGALYRCYGGESFEIQKSIAHYIHNKYKDYKIPYISVWNDAPERTYSEVISLCKELDI